MSRIRVAVLMGGTSSERRVSLSTGRQVIESLDPERYEAFPIDTAYLNRPALSGGGGNGAGTPSPALESGAQQTDNLTGPARELPDPSLPPLVGRNRPDVAVICLHGKHGEDGTIQGMLELLDIPYTGSGVLASALAIDKLMSKKVFEWEGIPTPPSVPLRSWRDAERFLAELAAGEARVTCPLVVKPSRQGSTIGISIVHEPAEVRLALEKAFEFDSDVLVEAFVEGIEITGAVLGNDDLLCLPLVEIVPASGFYDFEAKYTPGATDEIVPARIPEPVTKRAQELALRAHQALGCRGFSRTDMLVRGEEVWVLETNTIPGMTPTSLLPRAAQAAGIPFPQLVERMIELALEGRDGGPQDKAKE
ncbi:MAG: D-alanine--D-alanine ligase [Armatimonadota bacterium]